MIFTIDLNALDHNIEAIKNKIGDFFAVVKSNAYGFGLEIIVERLSQNGIEKFCANDIFTCIKIRSILEKQEKKAQIVCLYGFIEQYKELYINHDITPVVVSLEQFYAFKKYRLPYWFFIDTGLQRTGVFFDQFIEKKIIREIDDQCIGYFSHFINSCSKSLNTKQKEQMNYIYGLPGLKSFGKTFCSNQYTGYKDSIDRIGKGLYFYDEHLGTKNIGRCHSFIVKEDFIKKNSHFGYDHKKTAEKDLKIAIINGGYANGLDKNYPFVFVNGKKGPEKARILNVDMDLSTIDITDIDLLDTKVDIFGDFIDFSSFFGFSPNYFSAKISNVEYSYVF